VQRPIDDRDQDDKAGMERLRRIETAKIAGVVGDEDKIAVSSTAYKEAARERTLRQS
jgi:hypothetical protein